MLDRSKLPRTFTVPYGDVNYEFVVTNASDESNLVANVARDENGKRLQFGNGLAIDRHAGHFHFTEDLQADFHSLRPLAMKLNAIPAKLLSVAWRLVGGILGSGPRTFFIGGGDAGLIWNVTMLMILCVVIALAATIGIYVVAPLLALAVICFILQQTYFQPNQMQQGKAFAETIANQVRDLVEETVSY